VTKITVTLKFFHWVVFSTHRLCWKTLIQSCYLLEIDLIMLT